MANGSVILVEEDERQGELREAERSGLEGQGELVGGRGGWTERRRERRSVSRYGFLTSIQITGVQSASSLLGAGYHLNP